MRDFIIASMMAGTMAYWLFASQVHVTPVYNPYGNLKFSHAVLR